jgi:hypothetical protein
LLANGLVYLAFGSYADTNPFHGWLLAYNALTLAQEGVFLSTPNPVRGDRYQGSIWQSGQGPAADSEGNIYVATGNGNWDLSTGGLDYGDSVVKLRPALSVADWFTPFNQSALDAQDLDLGSTGPLLLPGTHLLLQGDKSGMLYLLDANNLGHWQAGSDSQIVQSFHASIGHIHGSPVCWTGPRGTWCYVWGEQDFLKAFALVNGTFQVRANSSGYAVPVSQSAMMTSPGMPGGVLSLSANGAAPGTGILWVTMPIIGNANVQTVPGIVRAFDASDLSHELWDSEMNESRDSLGALAKFAPPTIANGKAYVPTFSGFLAVYGLLSQGSRPTTAAVTVQSPVIAPSLPYNNSGASSLASAGQANFDGQGNSYSLSALRAAGVAPGVPVGNGMSLTWPDVTAGTPDNVVASGQVIQLTAHPQGHTLAFLGAASGGAATGTVTVTYTDGTTQHFDLGFNDWAVTSNSGTQLLPGTRIVATMPQRNTLSGRQDATRTYLYVAAVPLDASRRVAQITLPAPHSGGRLHIFAMAVTQTPVTQPRTSAR